ncbi:MAG: hypothetical protein C5B51_08200 [Terriglobia bacterium]|nr:MAG: hypothetical protein C5B51_08200 [Terriglobia bacterium]
MKVSPHGYVLVLALSAAVSAGAQTGFPFQDETLHYTVNWPSGLSLGDAALMAHRQGARWDLEMNLDARIPGFPIADRFHSMAGADLCSDEFERSTSHGARKSTEKTTYDYKTGTARRATANGGGSTEFTIPPCARDALAFLYFARREMGQGRVAPAQQIFFGSVYSIRLEYTGAQTITAREQQAVTDRVLVTLRGPASSANFEIFFARDAARTPLLVRVPLSVGTFSLELAR